MEHVEKKQQQQLLYGILIVCWPVVCVCVCVVYRVCVCVNLCLNVYSKYRVYGNN